MEKRGQIKTILIVLISLIILTSIGLFFVLRGDESKLSEEEIKTKIQEVTDNEIIEICYHKKCLLGEGEKNEIYIVTTKLKEKYDTQMMGELEYQSYVFNKEGNLTENFYTSTVGSLLCERESD